MKKVLILLGGIAFISNSYATVTPASTPIVVSASSYTKQLQQLEKEYHGHLGIAAINTANNTQLLFNADRRFPFCSTSKTMAAAAILKLSETDTKLLQQKIYFSEREIQNSGYAPITSKHVATGMTVSQLAQAAIEYSDNGAMNQLLKLVGGPSKITAFARSIGDNKFSLVRSEPQLNSAIPGDTRDTTTPQAMATSLQKLVVGSYLDQPQQQLLQQWLKANTTGDKRIRAGVPNDWIVGDKTGTGSYGTTNDIAVIWPPQGKPIILTVYFTQDKKDAKPQDEVIAKATKVMLTELIQK